MTKKLQIHENRSEEYWRSGGHRSVQELRNLSANPRQEDENPGSSNSDTCQNENPGSSYSNTCQNLNHGVSNPCLRVGNQGKTVRKSLKDRNSGKEAKRLPVSQKVRILEKEARNPGYDVKIPRNELPIIRISQESQVGNLHQEIRNTEGSVADPWHFGEDPVWCVWPMDPDLDSDPDPAIFIIDLQEPTKN